MRAVRCAACGAKALLAAAKCPKCGHLFDVRDGFGELLPLAYCSSCDSYYPEHLGSCRWCGTKPERAPIGPYVWKGVGAVALVAMVVTAWVLRDSGAKIAADPVAQSAPQTDTSSSGADTGARRLAIIPADSGAPLAQPEPSQMSDTSPSGRTMTASAGSIARDSANSQHIVQSASEPERASPSPPTRAPAETPRAIGQRAPTADAMSVSPRAVAKGPPVAKAATKLSSQSSRSRKTTARWVSSISRHWVLVRADASRSSRVIASIGPNTRVQLGETRGEWRRIRARGLSGWVEHAAFFAALGGSGRPHGLATR